MVLLEDFPRLAVTDIAGFFHVLSISRIGNSLQGSAYTSLSSMADISRVG